MAQSLAQILLHLVFSTKHREPLLEPPVRPQLSSYIGGIVRLHRGTLLCAGSAADHIHLLLVQPRTCSPAELVQEIKTGSSKWLKTHGARYSSFHWQNGYGVFSVSASHRSAVAAYLEQQEEHHRIVSFQEEYRELLRKNGIQYDERYVWD
jgi:REP element-mobilizing transposase RayT